LPHPRQPHFRTRSPSGFDHSNAFLEGNVTDIGTVAASSLRASWVRELCRNSLFFFPQQSILAKAMTFPVEVTAIVDWFGSVLTRRMLTSFFFCVSLLTLARSTCGRLLASRQITLPPAIVIGLKATSFSPRGLGFGRQGLLGLLTSSFSSGLRELAFFFLVVNVLPLFFSLCVISPPAPYNRFWFSSGLGCTKIPSRRGDFFSRQAFPRLLSLPRRTLRSFVCFFEPVAIFFTRSDLTDRRLAGYARSPFLPRRSPF